jgi:deoxycytidine triphosphate deaminase
MILTSSEILERKLVHNWSQEGVRHTTYDATVGEIIHEGKTHDGPSYVLPARGMVWVVSKEKFVLPSNITGLATLRTTWTHKGILALNVGIIDPCWSNHLAASLVNFSNTNFQFKKGDTFFRVLFMEHANTNAEPKDSDSGKYVSGIVDNSSKIPSTFLNLESLADEMLRKLYGSSIFANWLARFGLIVALAAGLIALIAIFVPIAYGVTSEFTSRKADVEKLKVDIAKIMTRQDDLQVEQRSVEYRIDHLSH